MAPDAPRDVGAGYLLIKGGHGRDQPIVEQGHVSTAAGFRNLGIVELGRVHGDVGDAQAEAPEGLGATGDPVFQIPWTTVGAPCVTIPYDTGPKGLPVGVQLIGRRGDDDTVLAVAKWFDARR